MYTNAMGCSVMMGFHHDLTLSFKFLVNLREGPAHGILVQKLFSNKFKCVSRSFQVFYGCFKVILKTFDGISRGIFSSPICLRDAFKKKNVI